MHRIYSAVFIIFVVSSLAQAGGNNGTDCWNPGDPPIGADVIVGDLIDTNNYGLVGGLQAYAIGTTSCNIGSDNLLWISFNNQHPVIAQHMFRLKSGRFEQIGQSWLKHGFTALTQNVCGCGCNGQGGSVLGVGCSDPYCCGLNGQQNGLGPKWQVNAHTGVYTYPFQDGNQGPFGDAIYKRLQVAVSDLDSAQNPSALYFVEGHYVTEDDAAAGNQNNNASYRRVGIAGNFNLNFIGNTQRGQPGIRAWKDSDPTVTESDVQIPGEGLLLLSSKATNLGNGFWHYEYALQNLNSDRSVGSFSVPTGPGVIITTTGFHDVPYHSGEPFDGTDWPAAISLSAINWQTTPFAQDSNANALRWGTLYNFRFDAAAAPQDGNVSIGLFKPGTPESIEALARVPGTPSDCNVNAIPDPCDLACGPAGGPCDLPSCGGQTDCNANLIPDSCDLASGSSPDCNQNGLIDDCDPNADNDAFIDDCDNCPAVFNPSQSDTDTDGVGNSCDNCPFNANPGQENCNHDIQGDACEADSAERDTDHDGICNVADNCPTVANPAQADSDSDGEGDPCDNCVDQSNASQLNSDGDALGNDCDNCPTVTNPDQADGDSDGNGDLCDNCPASTNADQADADMDGTGDACDPCPLDSPDDSDADGVCNSNDRCPEGDDNADSDGDGAPDTCDPCPLDNPDDSDGDGVCNVSDQCPGADDALDADGDGTPDCLQVPPGIPAASTWGLAVLILAILTVAKTRFSRRTSRAR